MTLVFQKNRTGPATHAVVIGVGRFPFLNGTQAKLMAELRAVEPVTSPPNNALAMAAWLIEAAEQLVPPLASVELLVSPVEDTTARLPGSEQDIEPATGDRVEDALLAWLGRCETDPGNLGFFFGSSHGMQSQEHVLLLEDAGAKPTDPWRNMLSLNHLHRNLYNTVHKRSLIFADCCRNLLEGGISSLDDFSGRRIGNITQQDYARARNDPGRFVYMLRASPPGVVAKAWKGGLGFLTEALLRCFSGGAGRKTPTYGWCISPERLRRWVEDVGRYGLGYSDAHFRPLDDDNIWDNQPILRLTGKPRFPVRVREADPQDLGRASLVLAHDPTAFRQERAPDLDHQKPLACWVEPSIDDYRAEGVIAEDGGTILLEPAAVSVSTEGQDVALRRAP